MSDVWNFFVKNNNNTSAQCNKCNKTFKWNSTHGTSSLKKHLSTHDINIQSNIKRPILIKKTEIPPDELADINEKYVNFVIKNCQPFRLSEDIYFVNFVDALNQDYKLLNRKQTRTKIEQLYDSKKILIVETLKNLNQKFSISLDVWTSIKNEQYIGVHIHFIHNFILKKYVIGFDKIHDQKAETIAEKLNDIFTDFELDTSNILSFTSDNCNTMKLTCDLLNNKVDDNNRSFNFFGCFAHIINLIIKESVLSSETIIKARDLAFVIKNSPKIINILENIALTNNTIFTTIKCDVPTRWNSSYIMIDSLIKNKNILTKVTSTNILKLKEWNELVTIKSLLEPFYDLTKIVSASKYPTIGLAYSVILSIYKYLNIFSENNKFKHKSVLMKEKFTKYFEFLNQEYFISMILDPRFKLKLLDEQQKNDIMEIIKNTFEKYQLEFNNKNKVEDQEKKIKHNTQISLFPPEIISNEIDTYITSPIVNQNTDILEWWKNNHDSYKILSIMATDYLAIPISSVSVEELFSAAGEIITDQRNRLQSDIIKKIMCLQNWII